MPRIRLPGAVAAAALFAGLAAPAAAGTLVINTDTSDPAPKAAFEMLIEQFEAEYPDITVEWNVFDHEGYKTAIRKLPDRPGTRHRRLVRRQPHGAVRQWPVCVEDVSDVWQEHGLTDSLGSALSAMTIDGAQWGVP